MIVARASEATPLTSHRISQKESRSARTNWIPEQEETVPRIEEPARPMDVLIDKRREPDGIESRRFSQKAEEPGPETRLEAFDPLEHSVDPALHFERGPIGKVALQRCRFGSRRRPEQSY